MNRILITIVLVLFLSSCEKELDFHYHEVDSQLVIEGHTSEMGTTVILSKTCPVGEPMDVTLISDAEIFLTDLTSGIGHYLHISNSGRYFDNDPGIVGHDYKIEVLYGGNKYEATCLMQPATKIVNLEFRWIEMPYDYVAVLQISFLDLQSTDDCYWIKLYRNDAPYKWILSDDRSAVNGMISEVIMTSRKNDDSEDEKSVLRDGDRVTVAISPVSRNMYDYLVAIQTNSNGPRMFVGDFCLGYYVATTECSDAITFHPDMMTLFNN